MVRMLRTGQGRNGLILANGGMLTYQHALCLSTRPRRDGSAYPERNPLPTHMTDIAVPAVTTHAEGEAIIEVSLLCNPLHSSNMTLTFIDQTYTVEFDRSGTPAKGFVVGRLASNNHRFVANTGTARSLEQLSSGNREPIGRAGWVRKGDEGRNLFGWRQGANL